MPEEQKIKNENNASQSIILLKNKVGTSNK